MEKVKTICNEISVFEGAEAKRDDVSQDDNGCWLNIKQHETQGYSFRDVKVRIYTFKDKADYHFDGTLFQLRDELKEIPVLRAEIAALKKTIIAVQEELNQVEWDKDHSCPPAH